MDSVGKETLFQRKDIKDTVEKGENPLNLVLIGFIRKSKAIKNGSRQTRKIKV